MSIRPSFWTRDRIITHVVDPAYANVSLDYIDIAKIVLGSYKVLTPAVQGSMSSSIRTDLKVCDRSLLSSYFANTNARRCYAFATIVN
jgi:hypothetical protein